MVGSGNGGGADGGGGVVDRGGLFLGFGISPKDS